MNEELMKHQAKKIMDSFMEALENVDEKNSFLQRERTMRESESQKGEEDFFDDLAKNAPNGVREHLFVSEKKKW